MNRTIYLLTIIIILASNITDAIAQQQIDKKLDGNRNFFDTTWQEKFFINPTNFTEKQLTINDNNVSVDILINDSINKILPTLFGVNTTFRSGNEMPTRVDNLYKPSGWKTYRYPAGSGSNEYFFDGVFPSDAHKVKLKNNIPDGPSEDVNFIDGTKSPNLTPNGFMEFIHNANGEATVVVNYFYARYGKTTEGTRDARVLQAAKYAAQFVKKMNIDNDANIKYWEIGNEIYGKWEDGFYVDGSDQVGGFIGEVTPQEYGEDCVIFAKEMKKVDPSIKIGVVVLDNNEKDWNSKVIPEVVDIADFLVVHNYFLAAKDQSAENILNSIVQIADIKETLDDATEASGKPRGYFPIAMTEYNIRAKIVNDVIIENHTISMLNAIFTSEVLGEFMKHGYGMSTRWVGEWKTGSDPYSDQKGTIAVNDPNQKAYSPRQAYMPYRYYASYFGDYLIGSTSNNDEIKIYASRFSDGKIALSIINQTSSTKKVKLSIPNASSVNMEFGNAFWYEIHADNIDLENTKFYINGETSSTKGGGPENFVDVKPFKSSFENNSVFEAKKYSINYIVIDVISEELSLDSFKRIDIKTYPNPVNGLIHIDQSIKVQSIKIWNLNGMIVKSVNYPSNNIDVNSLKPSQYFIEIRTDNGISVNKIIKM